MDLQWPWAGLRPAPGPLKGNYDATLVPHDFRFPLLGIRWDALTGVPQYALGVSGVARRGFERGGSQGATGQLQRVAKLAIDAQSRVEHL